MKKPKPIAQARLKLPEEVRSIDGLHIDEGPFLLAFAHEDNFYLIKNNKWSLEDSINLLFELKSNIDQISAEKRSALYIY
jgi:hypothetical protein